MTKTDFYETRATYLVGKTTLTDEDIAEIVELRHEYPDMKSLKKYTEKKYRDLSTDEKKKLIETLLSDDEYLKYKNCYIAKSKLLYDSSETLIKEIAAVSRLNDLGYVVYLLPYAYARDNMNCYQKSADSITAGDFLEMKSVVSTGDRAGQSTYKSSRLQADNVFISFVNDIEEEKAINNIFREIRGQKESNLKNGVENNFQGFVFLNFEKKGTTNLYKVSKDGFAEKIDISESVLDLKKSRELRTISPQVAENPMTEHGSSPINKVTEEIPAVNEKIEGASYDSPQVAVDPMIEHGSLPNSNITRQAEKSSIKQSKSPADLEKKVYETETTDLVQIFRQFGIYRNTLPKEHNEFVKRQMQKDYDTVTKTYELQGRTYTGTFREDSHRKENREAYAKEAKLATVLASMGFDVILIEENNSIPGTKPDAIVNGIVMDFKEIEALSEKDASKNRLGSDYRDGMRKKYSEGVVLLLHSFSETFVSENMQFKETRRGNNGLALFFHEDTGIFQLIDMEKIRAAHIEQLKSRSAPSVSTEPTDIKILSHSPEKSISESLKKNADLEKKVYERATVVVNGKKVVCEGGLLKGFCEEHKMLEAEREKNRLLSEKIERLRQSRSVSRDDDGWDY